MSNVHHTPIRVHLVSLPLVAWGLERLVESGCPRLAMGGSTESVADCLLSLHHFQPDVVVLDLDGEDSAEPVASLHSRSKAKILVVTGSRDPALHDKAVLAGARGIVDKRAAAPTLIKAIERVHEGEIWIDRCTTSRIFLELARRKSTADHPEQHKIASLTRRERQTIVAIANDASAPGKLVAERLHISEHTLRNHLTSIYSKLALANRLDLYAYSHKHGLSSIA